jgi:hypothetical protein
MDEHESRLSLLEPIRLRQVVVRRGRKRLRIRVEDVEHLELAMGDTTKGHGDGVLAVEEGWRGKGRKWVETEEEEEG